MKNENNLQSSGAYSSPEIKVCKTSVEKGFCNSGITNGWSVEPWKMEEEI